MKQHKNHMLWECLVITDVPEQQRQLQAVFFLLSSIPHVINCIVREAQWLQFLTKADPRTKLDLYSVLFPFTHACKKELEAPFLIAPVINFSSEMDRDVIAIKAC